MKQEYRTCDLAEAALIMSQGIRLITFEKEGRTVYFVFEEVEKCEEISRKFFFGSFMVDARIFYEIMNRLKNRIFAY